MDCGGAELVCRGLGRRLRHLEIVGVRFPQFGVDLQGNEGGLLALHDSQFLWQAGKFVFEIAEERGVLPPAWISTPISYMNASFGIKFRYALYIDAGKWDLGFKLFETLRPTKRPMALGDFYWKRRTIRPEEIFSSPTGDSGILPIIVLPLELGSWVTRKRQPSPNPVAS